MGSSMVSVVNGAGTGTALNLGTITRGTGGTVDFEMGANGTVTTATINGSGGILGGYATVGRRDWAVTGPGGASAFPITALATYTNDVWPSGDNTNLTGNSSVAGGVNDEQFAV